MKKKVLSLASLLIVSSVQCAEVLQNGVVDSDISVDTLMTQAQGVDYEKLINKLGEVDLHILCLLPINQKQEILGVLLKLQDLINKAVGQLAADVAHDEAMAEENVMSDITDVTPDVIPVAESTDTSVDDQVSDIQQDQSDTSAQVDQSQEVDQADAVATQDAPITYKTYVPQDQDISENNKTAVDDEQNNVTATDASVDATSTDVAPTIDTDTDINVMDTENNTTTSGEDVATNQNDVSTNNQINEEGVDNQITADATA